MGKKRTLTEAETLEQYRVAFENVEKQTEIATTMAEFGYEEALLNEGKTLLTNAREAYDANKTEDDETTIAYNNFSTIKGQLETEYSLHRKKGKVVFRKDENLLTKLGLTGSLPTIYIKWLETVKKFYAVAAGNTEIETALARLKVTPTELQETRTLITVLETARADYLKEKGESQDATKLKDAAVGAISDWMSEFYAIAKIALDDNPQLLESLGKFVRS
ncbi:hypothetical protein RRF68_00140 [Tenacibaculum sp. HL-MS23]|uniref:hypothetical protein n=1 Tax=Tenacibaculum sp. HL-MS23 TaxID=3077734 RepID=UPI0028FC0E15|nr:hypothetical protein [Tenacibaculum sp. HL-MS23]WNW01856.1 hypothetical protein RRF68_00140 [Tenacibaculum sp. HL-MS23]